MHGTNWENQSSESAVLLVKKFWRLWQGFQAPECKGRKSRMEELSWWGGGPVLVWLPNRGWAGADKKLGKSYVMKEGFPDSSVGKESACNAGNLGSIPELGRSWRRERLPTRVFWPGELHGLSMGSQRAGHNWKLDFNFTSLCHERTITVDVNLAQSGNTIWGIPQQSCG